MPNLHVEHPKIPLGFGWQWILECSCFFAITNTPTIIKIKHKSVMGIDERIGSYVDAVLCFTIDY